MRRVCYSFCRQAVREGLRWLVREMIKIWCKTGSDCWDTCIFYGPFFHKFVRRSWRWERIYFVDVIVASQWSDREVGYFRLVVWQIRSTRGAVCWQPRLPGQGYWFWVQFSAASRRAASVNSFMAQLGYFRCDAGLLRRSIIVDSRLEVP